jgi:hypothetical protein
MNTCHCCGMSSMNGDHHHPDCPKAKGSGTYADDWWDKGFRDAVNGLVAEYEDGAYFLGYKKAKKMRQQMRHQPIMN